MYVFHSVLLRYHEQNVRSTLIYRHSFCLLKKIVFSLFEEIFILQELDLSDTT